MLTTKWQFRIVINEILYYSIVNFPFLCSNIPLSPSYGVYISQLIHFARTRSAYDQVLSHWQTFDVTEVSNISFTVSISQMTRAKIARYNFVQTFARHLCRKQLERNYMTWNRKRYSKITHFQQKSTEICVFMQVIFFGATLEPKWKFVHSYVAM
jgi:hypothetical protein